MTKFGSGKYYAWQIAATVNDTIQARPRNDVRPGRREEEASNKLELQRHFPRKPAPFSTTSFSLLRAEINLESETILPPSQPVRVYSYVMAATRYDEWP